jgi:osmoprotectant transport system substrate-binding protein
VQGGGLVSRFPLRLAVVLIWIAAAIVMVAGCGSSGTRTTSTTAAATTSASAGDTTVAEITNTAVTNSPGTTITTTTGTGTDQTTTTPLPGTGKPTVLLGDMNTPEQFILGALYYEALRSQGYSVETTRNIGVTQVSVDAVKQGSLDLYPEYLNVWDSQAAGDTKPFSSLADAYAAGQAYAQTQKLELLPPTPASNTSGIAVLSSYAAMYDVRTLADLAQVAPTLTIGSPVLFTREATGLPAIEQAYGFTPGTVKNVNVGSQYGDLRNGLIQAAYVATTDGQLAQPEYHLLSDPKHILGFGNIVPVVSQANLTAEGPAFAATIEEVDALLTTRALRGLNAEVELYHHDPDLTAREFLQGYGLLAPPLWPTVITTTVTTTTPTSTTTTTTTVTTTTGTTTTPLTPIPPSGTTTTTATTKSA